MNTKSKPIEIEWLDQQTDPKRQVCAETGIHKKKQVIHISYHNPCVVAVTHKKQTIQFETSLPGLARKLAVAAYKVMAEHKTR